MFGGEDYRLAAGDAGNPDPRMRLLHRHGPRIDDAKLVVSPFPAPGTRGRPDFHDQVMGLFETLAIKGRVGVGRQRFGAAAAHKTGNQPPLGDHIDHRQLFGQANRIFGNRQRIAQQHDFDPLGHPGQQRGEDVDLGLHAERAVVMLVEHNPVEAHFFRQDVFLQPLIVEPATLLGVEVMVGENQDRIPEPVSLLGRISGHRLLGEIHQMHRKRLLSSCGRPTIRSPSMT